MRFAVSTVICPVGVYIACSSTLLVAGMQTVISCASRYRNTLSAAVRRKTSGREVYRLSAETANTTSGRARYTKCLPLRLQDCSLAMPVLLLGSREHGLLGPTGHSGASTPRSKKGAISCAVDLSLQSCRVYTSWKIDDEAQGNVLFK